MFCSLETLCTQITPSVTSVIWLLTNLELVLQYEYVLSFPLQFSFPLEPGIYLFHIHEDKDFWIGKLFLVGEEKTALLSYSLSQL